MLAAFGANWTRSIRWSHCTRSIWAEAHELDEGDDRVDAVALNLHGFYASLERVFEMISTRIDRSPPGGARWHQELLDQRNTTVPDVRPVVISDETRKKLDAYRGFRHVVRNVYTFDFDPDQLELLVRRLPETRDHVFQDLRAFADTLESIAAGEKNQ